MPDLSTLTRDDLLRIFGEIVAHPGDFTEQDLDDIAAINLEFLKRGYDKCKVS